MPASLRRLPPLPRPFAMLCAPSFPQGRPALRPVPLRPVSLRPVPLRIALGLLVLCPAAAQAQSDPRTHPDDPTSLNTALPTPQSATTQSGTTQAAPPQSGSFPRLIPAPIAATKDAAIAFEADKAEYLTDSDTVVASGNVFLRRADQTVRADKVTWDHTSGKILAEGHIRVVDADGNELLTDKLELNDQLVAGDTSNLLMLLREGGRLAAETGQRMADGKVLLSHASYTACEVVAANGCPKKPSWKVTAIRVVFDPAAHTVRFKGARIAAFGIVRLPMPNFVLTTDGRAVPGLLIPDFRITASNGLEYKQTYYQHLGLNRDITITGDVFSKVAPMVSAKFRDLTELGAFQLTAYATQSPVIPVSGNTTANQQNQLRGYFDANGKLQFSPEWSLDFSGRIVSDRTFLLRYNINSDDVLRSTADLERVTHNSYLSIAGWAFQTLRTNESQGLVPIALPEIDYRRRLDETVLGGTLDLQANSLAISRSAGQDTQRAFASAQWNLRRLTPWGQQITFTALTRADIYHASNNDLTSIAIYQGLPGWHPRLVATGAVDVTWPLIGTAFGGTQVLTPHVQVVATPATANLSVPNEDSRALELEDDNLFALNRFAGYDRIEDGTRVTYGLDWQLERPKWRILANIGQSYRLTSEPTLLPQGTGLTDQLSDIVGRTEIRYRDFFKITHRYRIDKGDGTFRRNEVDATIGSDSDYVEVGYARINRGLSTTSLEDLSDSNELRAAARVAFARHWSLFGSGIVDMSGASFSTGTGTTVNPASFQPLRTRLGLSFQSDCFQFDATWRRDYVTIGDAVRGSSFELHFALRNLGFK